jgi:hypothetical protein
MREGCGNEATSSSSPGPGRSGPGRRDPGTEPGRHRVQAVPGPAHRTSRTAAPAAAEQPFELPIEAYVAPAAPAAPGGTLGNGCGARGCGAQPGRRACAPVWEIRLADNNLSRALTRWAAAAPDKLPILWEASSDLPAVAARYSGDFLSAIEQVMRDTGNSQYPLHACAYDNVVRVLHVSQPCVRTAVTASATALGADQ